MKEKISENLGNHDWERLVALTTSILLLFFYTRSCPFPAGTYWDLLTGRDFLPLNPWVLSPERISCLIAQSSASLTGLKALYHAVFFLLCGVLTIRVFRGPEALPGVIVLYLFAFAIQPLLSLRDLLQLLILAVLVNAFSSRRFEQAIGLVLIPISAIAALLGLAVWLIPVLVICHVVLNKNNSPTLIICSFAGLLLFLDSSGSAILGTSSFSAAFPNPDSSQLLSVLAGIFLIPNLLALPLLADEDLPNLVFYSIVGIISLLNQAYMPIFVLVGVVLLLTILSHIRPLSLNANIAGILFLAVVLHLFLFLSPLGFRINPAIRSELGPDLEPLLTRKVKTQSVPVWQIGEIAWKGLITLVDEDLPLLENHAPLWIVENAGRYGISNNPSTPNTASTVGDLGFDQSVKHQADGDDGGVEEDGDKAMDIPEK